MAGGYIYRHQDISVGSGAFPTTLTFARTYDSGLGQIGQNTSLLGNGWMHNYDITALPDSDGFEGMGQNSPISGAPAIAAIYVVQDILNLQTSTAKPVDRVIVAAMAERWLMDQLTNNVVAIARAGSVERFILLPTISGPNVYNAPFGSTSVLTANANGGYTYTTKTGETLTFNPPAGTAPGRVTQWMSPNGASVSFAYNGNGQLQSVRNPNSQQQLNFTYNANDQLTSVSDNTGRSVSYGYDGQGNLQSFTDPLHYQTTYTYGSIGELTQIFYPSNPSNPFVSMVYDSLGRSSQQADALGHLTNLYFAGTRTETDDPAGTAHISYFSSRGKVLASIEGLGSPGIEGGAGNKTTTAYDGLDRPVLVTLPEGGTTAYTYATAVNPWANNVATITRTAKPGSSLAPLTTSFAYDPIYNKPTQITDPLGLVTQMNYDPATGNLLTAVADAGSVGHFNAISRFSYDSHGKVLSATDPLGVVTAFSYDAFENLLARVSDSGGAGHLNLTTRYAYDAVGDVVARTDPNGNTSAMTYDADRRLLMTTAPAPFNSGASLVQTSNTYDPDGRLLTVTLANGSRPVVIRTSYTTTGKVQSVTDANGNVTINTYDADDRLATVTDPLRRLTIYGYDALSRQVSVSNPAIQAASLLQQSYTPDGLIGSLTDANGNTTAFTPDGFDRLSTTTYPDSSTEVLSYDADDNVLSRQTRAGATITFTYDTLNRLSSKAAPSEAMVSYAYDLASHLIGVSDNSTSIVTPAASASYVENLSYDQLNRPLAATWSPVQPQAPPAASSSATFGFTYDATNRRVGQSASDNSWWSYPTSATNVSYTPNNLNQYIAVSSVVPTYDGNGNLTYDGTFTYCYDAESRLTSILSVGTCVSPTTTVASYVYDAQGRRKSKTVNGTTTIYVTDTDNREVLEYDGTSGAVGNWYSFAPASAFGPDAVLNRINGVGTTRATLIPDIQGSIIGVLDAASGGLTKIGYQTYGENPSLSSGSYRYTARRFDPETAGSASQPSGLYYYRARMYSPAWGRFWQVDSVGYQGGANLYAYVNNDPLNNVDPSGLQQIPPDAMVHILNAHGINTPRTNPGNSVFNQEYSNPSTLQQLSNDVFASPLAPPAPFYGGLQQIQGQVLLQNQNTGATQPYMIGTDANGNPTNQVLIRYDPITGNVETMFPVPITGSQSPQSSNSIPGSDFIPASASISSGNLAGSDENSFTPTAAGTASGSPSSSMK